MRRRGLLQPIDYQGERRELAKARKAAFADPPTGPNQVWQLDFSEYETTTGGIWRLAGVLRLLLQVRVRLAHRPDLHRRRRHRRGQDRHRRGRAAAGGVPLARAAPRPADTGRPRIKLVTDNGGAFKGHAFAAFIASRPELLHIRTRRKSPGQNGVRERAFGSLKYEHLYRMQDRDAARPGTARPRLPARVQPRPAARGPGPSPADRSSSQSFAQAPTQDHKHPTFSQRILSQVLDAGQMAVTTRRSRAWLPWRMSQSTRSWLAPAESEVTSSLPR